jgi:peptidoglycan/xylan/chitin deacetylase (PgdA/CDA1 family)
MDYANLVRIKLWGSGRVVEGDDALLARLSDKSGGAPERAILFELDAWDRNCSQHIPRLLPVEDVQKVIEAEVSRRCERG